MYKDRIMLNYWVQIEHGEVAALGNQFSMGYVGGSPSGGIDIGDRDMGNVNWEDNINHYQEMVFDAIGPKFGMCSQSNEFPNPKAQRFYGLLKAAKEPLWEGCVHSELSLAVRMLSIKSEENQSQSFFDQWIDLIRELSLQLDSIPKDFYQAKKLVSKLRLK